MRQTLSLFAILLIVGLSSVAFGQATSDKTTAASKSTFLVTYSPGQAWIKGKLVKEQPLKEHFQFMVGLYQKGVMKFAGPFGDGTGGAAVIEAIDIKEAESLIAADPAVKLGIMKPNIRAWELVQWEKYLKK